MGLYIFVFLYITIDQCVSVGNMIGGSPLTDHPTYVIGDLIAG